MNLDNDFIQHWLKTSDEPEGGLTIVLETCNLLYGKGIRLDAGGVLDKINKVNQRIQSAARPKDTPWSMEFVSNTFGALQSIDDYLPGVSIQHGKLDALHLIIRSEYMRSGVYAFRWMSYDLPGMAKFIVEQEVLEE